MGNKKYRQVNAGVADVKNTEYTRADFIATIEKLMRPTPQSLTGAGTVDLTFATCVLSSVTGGPYVVTLPDGSDENELQEIFFTGTGGSFSVRGTFWEWTSLTFDTNGRSATLIWAGGKWMLVGGNCTPV